MLTEQAANDIARVILDNWDDWEASAGQYAQSEQTPQAWRDTMLKKITETVWRGAMAKTKEIRGANIPKTGHHDAGAIARCSYCGRYSDDPRALQYDPRATSAKDLRCDCGKTHGWCGSFKPPTAGSIWSK